MLIVVLPVFNESDGIEDFLNELKVNLDAYEPTFIVVSDKSTDSTIQILSKMQGDSFPLIVLQNETNRGHGFTVLKGLTAAISENPVSIILCDGDGQFNGSDIKHLFETHLNHPFTIIEGVRVNREDPWFRRFLSSATRLLVWASCREKPKDANTPLRVFYRQDVERLLREIDEDCLIPNLAMSLISRKLKIRILEIEVRSQPPRRNQETIDQWQQKVKILPSTRLIRFVVKAFIQWIKIAKNH
jgi:glycosyltransferase involved in cell wall biosynthesis